MRETRFEVENIKVETVIHQKRVYLSAHDLIYQLERIQFAARNAFQGDNETANLVSQVYENTKHLLVQLIEPQKKKKNVNKLPDELFNI